MEAVAPARRLSAAAAAADGLETSGEDTTETLARFGLAAAAGGGGTATDAAAGASSGAIRRSRFGGRPTLVTVMVTVELVPAGSDCRRFTVEPLLTDVWRCSCSVVLLLLMLLLMSASASV